METRDVELPDPVHAELTVPFVRDALARHGTAWVRQGSTSMLPLVGPGDALRLAPAEPRRIRPGTLIAYHREGRLVVHRVVARDGAAVVAKGDGLAAPDPPVAWDQVVARVVTLRGRGGRHADLETFPWPLANRLLGTVAHAAGRLRLDAAGHAGRRSWRRLAWKVLRLPFHLARLLLR